MTWTYWLFGFRGRLNRARYWWAALIYAVVAIAYTIALFSMVGTNPDTVMSRLANAVGMLALGGILFVIVFWSSLAISVKRLHDRDMSGWWLVIFYIVPSVIGSVQNVTDNTAIVLVSSLASLAISIWALIELGFRRGTIGSNRFGPDPLMSALATPLPA